MSSPPEPDPSDIPSLHEETHRANKGSTDSAVVIQGVTKTYQTPSGSVEAIEAISLDVRVGEFLSVLGPSGCGKSTLLKITAGLIPSTTGETLVGQQRVEGPVTDLGIVFQDDLLLPWRTVLRNVLLQMEIRRLPPAAHEEEARQLLSWVGLAGFEDKFPRELSGGMRQRVAICRALIHDPPLLLMDEPFGALDAITRDQMSLDLREICSRTEKTVIFVTHSISEAVFLSDRVVVMSPRPGKVERVFVIDLPRKRPLSIRESPPFNSYTSEIRLLFEQMGVLSEESDDDR